jgi:predicted AAA+ superfamily ATPase
MNRSRNAFKSIFYLELLRRDYKVTVGKTGNKEIDFVCDKRGEKLYVQVTYLLASDETIQREFGAYDNIRDNYPKYVVSLDEFDMSRNGIKHRNGISYWQRNGIKKIAANGIHFPKAAALFISLFL